MKYYVGIDLGTTNSAICSYDGQTPPRIWKSPEQMDVTPSAIFITKRGNRYYGKKAYDEAARNPDNSATLFKRFMGTSRVINLPAVDVSMTPEECSAEILRILFGYLPEEIRTSPDVATVITVPAAFNQTQKEATLQAAQLAGLGKVALMQEPVAAIMSIMRTQKQEGTFLVYDLGGGTFDVSIADSYGGKVNLLALGGKASCGGRDFDRLIFQTIVVPWLLDNFALPQDFMVEPEYKTLCRIAHWAVEKAKIELSARNESNIFLDETEVRTLDLDDSEIYLDIPLSREYMDSLIEDMIIETVDEARDTIAKAGFTTDDIDQIVFVGGPPNYKPLRDNVTLELAIPVTETDINPINFMTAVAEGASIFAESIDWSSEKHYRKSSTGTLTSNDELDITFKYMARTADDKAMLVAHPGNELEGFSFEIRSLDTGWSSGRLPLAPNKTMELSLTKEGENTFNIAVYDSSGHTIKLKNSTIIITKTMATVESIPASHSLGIEVLDKLGGAKVLEYMVSQGEALPKKGKTIVKAGQTIKAGSSQALYIKIWEGDILGIISDNRFVGVLKISGMDFDNGIISTGDDLECEYEISDSGNLSFEVLVASIGAAFSARFSIDEGKIDLDNVQKVIEDATRTLDRINAIYEKINNEPKLDKAREKIEKVVSLGNQTCEAEDVQKAIDEILSSKKLLAQTKQEYRKLIRQMDLDTCVEFFDEYLRRYAKPTEANAFDNLAKTAQRSIDRNEDSFENELEQLKIRSFRILWRQDGFVIDRFNYMIEQTWNYTNLQKFEQLKNAGLKYRENDEIDKLRNVIIELYDIQTIPGLGEDMYDNVNIIRG